MDLGTYVEHNGRPAVRFERTYTHSIDRVWAAVSDPAEMAHWFPFSVTIEARAGGAITFAGNPHTEEFAGVILTYDPPRHLAFTWGQDALYFDLEPVGNEHCRLTLINILEDRTTAARNAAGWSVCLGELDKLIEGRRAEGPHSAGAEPWQGYYETYIASGMPSGAAIPTAPTSA
jgi:uncharacterized protein YndB with AHSA1/START domain